MAYVFVDNQIGSANLLTWEATAFHPLGTQRKVYDSTYGEGQAVYVKANGTFSANDLVKFDTKNLAATVVDSDVAASIRGPVGVALATCGTTSTFGWLLIEGTNPITSGTVAANAAIFATSTAGTVDDAVVSGNKVDGVVSLQASSGGTTVCALSYPSMNGNG